jgi:hypothetical protein
MPCGPWVLHLKLESTQLEMRILHQMYDIVFRTAVKIVETYHVVTLRKQSLAEVRTKKASPPRNQYPFAVGNSHSAPF